MPSTTYTLLASALPALQGPGAARIVGDLSTDAATIYGADTFADGDTSIVTRKLNHAGLQLDYASKCGAMGYGVVEGLTFSGSALSITVAAGKATIDGLIELHTAEAVVITNTTNYIWLKRDGSLEVKTTNAAPAIPACFIGVVVAAAGAVVNYDLSGVMYHVNGLLRRKTGDPGKPTDTPGVTWCFLQISSSATYLWTGTEYLQITQIADPTRRATALAETVRRQDVDGDSGAILTSGQLFLVAFTVDRTTTVSSLTFLSGTTALSGTTHAWAALYNSGLALLSQSTDNVSLTWSANSEKTFTLGAAQVLQPGNIYYAGLMIAGTVPSLMAASLNAIVTALNPILCGTSTGSLTATAPNPAGAITATAKLPYAWAS